VSFFRRSRPRGMPALVERRDRKDVVVPDVASYEIGTADGIPAMLHLYGPRDELRASFAIDDVAGITHPLPGWDDEKETEDDPYTVLTPVTPTRRPQPTGKALRSYIGLGRYESAEQARQRGATS